MIGVSRAAWGALSGDGRPNRSVMTDIDPTATLDSAGASLSDACAGVYDLLFDDHLVPFDAWTNPSMMLPAALFSIPAALGNNNINWITTMKWTGGQP